MAQTVQRALVPLPGQPRPCSPHPRLCDASRPASTHHASSPLETPELAPPPWPRRVSGAPHSLLFICTLIHPRDFTACGWLPNRYGRFSPHLYWTQISLFNHCLIRSLGSLLGTWPEMKLWSWHFKITLHLSKGTTAHPAQTIRLEVALSPSLLIATLSNLFPFSFQLHSKSGQLPPSQGHQPTPLTYPTYMAVINASLPPCWPSFQLALCVLYSKMYMFFIF